MSIYLRIVLFAVSILSLAMGASAGTVGVDFVGGSAPGNNAFAGDGPVNSMGNSETAGVVPQQFWNNAGISGQSNTTVNAAGTLTAGTVLDDTGGIVPGLSVSWSAFNTFSMPVPDAPGNNRMMRGYLDTGTASGAGSSTASIHLSGLPPAYTTAGYNLILYCDGHSTSGIDDRIGRYTIYDGPTSASPQLGEILALDPNGSDFSGTFIQSTGTGGGTATAGNYIVFQGLHAATVTINALGISGLNPRAPINGLQIVAVPEPTALLVLAVGGLLLIGKRGPGSGRS